MNPTEALSSLSMSVLAIVLALAAWQATHRMMQHALLGGATWVALTVLSRVLHAYGLITLDQRALFNASMSAVVVTVLAAIWAFRWWMGRREGVR